MAISNLKTIGMLGGISCESTQIYYSTINKFVQARAGRSSSAQILLYSFNFQQVADLQAADAWDELGKMFTATAQNLERAGAECIVITANTMHILADEVAGAVSVPLLHIVPPVADKIKTRGFGKVALLGTKYTMEKDFLRRNFEENHQLEILLPDADARAEIHRIIGEELARGQVQDAARKTFRQIIGALQKQGAEAVILGCTELGMAIDDDLSPVPTFDTATIHAQSVAEWSLN